MNLVQRVSLQKNENQNYDLMLRAGDDIGNYPSQLLYEITGASESPGELVG